MSLPLQDVQALYSKLQQRFDRHMKRHADATWAQVQARLAACPEALPVLQAMEASGGEPDVIGRDGPAGAFIFCACYDAEARESRKEHAPATSAVEAAQAMGVELLDEAQYRALQALGAFDTKTSSWLATPPEVRALGGALFGDRRYDRVFVYHNGAQSCYAARGFRGLVRV